MRDDFSGDLLVSLWLLSGSDWLCTFHLHFLILVARQVNYM